MKIALSPGQRIDCGRSGLLNEPDEAPDPPTPTTTPAAPSAVEPLPWDPSAIRGPADRLRVLVEKRGA